MFTSISRAAIGQIIIIVTTIIELLDLQVDISVVEPTVTGVAMIVGIIISVWGQFKRKDLKYGIVRR